MVPLDGLTRIVVFFTVCSCLSGLRRMRSGGDSGGSPAATRLACSHSCQRRSTAAWRSARVAGPFGAAAVPAEVHSVSVWVPAARSECSDTLSGGLRACTYSDTMGTI